MHYVSEIKDVSKTSFNKIIINYYTIYKDILILNKKAREFIHCEEFFQKSQIYNIKNYLNTNFTYQSNVLNSELTKYPELLPFPLHV